MAFVLHPTHHVLGWRAIIGLMSGLLNADSQVYYHKIMKQSDVKSATLLMFTFSTLLAFIPVVMFWHPLVNTLISFDIHNNYLAYSSMFLLFVGLAFVSISNKIFRGKAYSKVSNAGQLTPFLYASIVFAGLLDWMVYGMVPDYLSIMGTVFIILSGLILYFSYRKRCL